VASSTQALIELSIHDCGREWVDHNDNSLEWHHKTELVRNRGPWRSLEDLEVATLEWVDWFNHRRLFGELGHIPAAEFEANYYFQNAPTKWPRLNKPGLRATRGDSSRRGVGSCCTSWS
jgi:transposase InsO family protein